MWIDDWLFLSGGTFVVIKPPVTLEDPTLTASYLDKPTLKPES